MTDSAAARVRVAASLPAYRAAVAELPASLTLHDGAFQGSDAAITVVPGRGAWWQEALAARAAGAAALVIADPGPLPPEARAALADLAGLPVVVERPRLRADVGADAVAARAGTPARLVAVECAVGASDAAAVVRDGVGWARLLAGGTLRLRAGRATGRGGMALLESDGVPGGGGAAAGGGSAVPATLAVGMLAGQGQGGLLRVAVLGEVRSEVTVDERAGLTRVETWTGDGGRIAPSRYESSARLALRRALEAARTDCLLPDLGELRDDDALAAALLLPRGV